MTNFAYNNGVPAGPNDPSDDQPEMLINTQSIQSILAVDHVTLGVDDGGTHKQINFVNKFAQGAQTDPKSVLFTASGLASTNSQAVFKNQLGTFPVSALRAFVSFNNAGLGAIAPLNQYNIVSVINTGSLPLNQTYQINLVANAVTGLTPCILVSLSNSQATYIYTYAANQLTLNVAVSAVVALRINVAFLQY